MDRGGQVSDVLHVGSRLIRRFARIGFHACGYCKLLAKRMDIEGPQWCEANADALAAKIDGNLRHQTGAAAAAARLTPGPIRRAWIKRQILKAARR